MKTQSLALAIALALTTAPSPALAWKTDIGLWRCATYAGKTRVCYSATSTASNLEPDSGRIESCDIRKTGEPGAPALEITGKYLIGPGYYNPFLPHLSAMNADDLVPWYPPQCHKTPRKIEYKDYIRSCVNGGIAGFQHRATFDIRWTEKSRAWRGNNLHKEMFVDLPWPLSICNCDGDGGSQQP